MDCGGARSSSLVGCAWARMGARLAGPDSRLDDASTVDRGVRDLSRTELVVVAVDAACVAARRRVRRARALRPTANCLQARLQLGPTPACPSSGPARASAAPYGQLSTSSTPARPYARLPVVGSGARERCALRPTVYKLDSSSALRALPVVGCGARERCALRRTVYQLDSRSAVCVAARRRVRRARALRPTANRRYFSSSCLTWAITWGAWIGLVM